LLKITRKFKIPNYCWFLALINIPSLN